MTYDAIAFDLDGVLLRGYHTDQTIYRLAGQEALADFGVETEKLPSSLVNPDESDPIRAFCEKRDIPADSFWGYREHASTILENDRIRTGGRLPFDDVDVLQRLAEHTTLGIVSNNRQGTVRFVCEYFDWGSHISVAYGRRPSLAGYDRMKPDPYYLQEFVSHLDVDAADVLFVGDRISDVETASRVGTDAALLSRDGSPPAGEAEPTVIIESLHDLEALEGVRD